MNGSERGAGRPTETRHLGPAPHSGVGRGRLLRAYATGALLHLPELAAVPHLPRAALHRLVMARVRKLVAHAQAHVPYYREVLAGISAADLRSYDDIRRLPTLSKDALRERASDLIADTAPPRERLLERTSSGSSGRPIKMYFDPIGDLPRRVQELRMLFANGYSFTDTQLIFDHPSHMSRKKFAVQKLGLWRREVFPVWLPVEEALRFIKERRPEVLHGVLSSLRLLALAAPAVGGLGYKPKFLLSKGELLDPTTRRVVESALDARIVDYYATEETGIIAWQCPEGDGYHIDEDHVLVETMRADGSPCDNDEVGEILLTNLYQRTMPFLRYRVGDLGCVDRSPCVCGRTLPRLRRLQGRKVDLITSPEGGVFHPMVLMAVMEEITEVVMFRLTQQREDLLVAELMLDSALAPAAQSAVEERVRRGLADIVGTQLRVEVAPLKHDPSSLAQKFALVRGLGRATSATTNVRF
jgi:phenylacetate-CoA ligase